MSSLIIVVAIGLLGGLGAGSIMTAYNVPIGMQLAVNLLCSAGFIAKALL